MNKKEFREAICTGVKNALIDMGIEPSFVKLEPREGYISPDLLHPKKYYPDWIKVREVLE